MSHPQNARGGWKLDTIVFDCGGADIVVALLMKDDTTRMALRWTPPVEYTDKNGKREKYFPWTEEETEWFLLPLDFSVAIAKMLIERKVTKGMDECFNEGGFEKMVKWLVDNESLSDAICY